MQMFHRSDTPADEIKSRARRGLVRPLPGSENKLLYELTQPSLRTGNSGGASQFYPSCFLIVGSSVPFQYPMLCCVSKQSAAAADLELVFDVSVKDSKIGIDSCRDQVSCEEDVPPILLPCAICARTFKPLSLEKHAKICEKTAIKKRKPFDSAKQRIQGTDLAEFLPVQSKRRINHEDKISKSKSSWKQTHDEFLQAIRAARGDVDDVSSIRHAASSVSTAAPTRANEKGTCPTCNRQFGIKAYDRHVAWCRERSNRLPVNAATNIAKERLEARIKYRAPALRNRKITNREKYSPGSTVSLSTTEKILPSITGSKAKESMSVPSCVKTNDSPSKPKPVTGRRLGQHREPLNTSGPMKSRLMDRTNRPTEEFESGPTSTRTSSSYPRCFELPSASLKSKNTVTKVTSPPLKCIRKPDIRSSFLPSSFKTSSPGIEPFKPRINLISARSYNDPKLNDVSVNREIVEMTVRPCNIYRDQNMTSWKQIGNTKSETFAGRRFSLGENNAVDPIDAEQKGNSDDVIRTPATYTRKKTSQRDDAVGRLKTVYHQVSAKSLKHDILFPHSTELDTSKLILTKNVAKLDESYSVKESRDSEDSFDSSEFKWKSAKYSPRIEFFTKDVKDSVPINDGISLNSEIHVTCLSTEKEIGKSLSESPNSNNEKILDSNHREESETQRSKSPEMNETRIYDCSLESPREVCYQLPETSNDVVTPINLSPRLSNEKSFHLQTSTPNKSPRAECSSSSLNNRVSRKKTKNNRTGRTYRKIWRFGKSAGSNKRSKNCATGGNINCTIDISNEISRSNEVFPETVHDVCSSATGIGNMTDSLNNTSKLKGAMDTKRCGTYVIERKSMLSAKHHASDESPDDKPIHKRRKTEITDSCIESRTQTDISTHRDYDQHLTNAETSPKIFPETTGMSDVALRDVKREVRDEFADKNSDYDSDDVSTANNCSNDESDKEKSSLREADASKDASFENCNVIISHPVIRCNARCSLLQSSNCPDSFAMQKSIQRSMNILNESTDSLASSVNGKTRGSRLVASSGYCQKEICTIRSIGNNNSIRTGEPSTFLPEILHHASVDKLSIMEKTYNSQPQCSLSYWDKAAKSVPRKLLTLDPPKTTFRLTKRNSKFHFLPSMNPFNPSVVESSSGTSQDYDPFLAAERQMNELFEGTGDQFLTKCSPTNSPDYPSNSTNVAQFPLSHSSAFVKYPSSPSANKRASVIAPPSEFDDFTSDFSSDSTETNSVTQEFFINNLNEQTREIDDFDKMTRDCNRRVVIDKSKAASDNDVNANSNRGKTFVSSVERSRKILEKVSPKVTRPTVNRSHSVRSSRAASAPRAPERKSSLKKITSQKNDYTNVYNPTTNNNNSYSNLSGSNLSLSSMPSSDVDIKRSNSVFDELLSSFEDDSSSFPSLKSFLKSDSISTSMSSPLQGSRPRNGMISDEELSSPDSYKRRDHSKMSADSAYSSLNRKCSNHGRSTTDVGSRLDEETAPKRCDANITPTKLKMSKFCHECGSRFPESAKFCCECGIKRLCL